jgi:steroid delta-isomerase-like uncharacterized protein
MPGPRELVHRFYDQMWNRFDVTALDGLVVDDVRFRGSLGGDLVGREALAGYVHQVRAAFPDFHNEVVELVVDDGQAAARLRYRGTHEDQVLGVPATGRRVTYDGAAFFTFADDRIASVWVLGDRWALWQELTAG